MILGKYIRLSSQDDDLAAGEKAESNSVANQRMLLDRYVQTHADLRCAEILEFIDDGHSGINFDRPGFQAMMEMARSGRIDCIIVKDCSRLGRNYIEVGDYLEQVFPFLGIRFISVNDCYDSKDRKYGTAGDLDMGLRNLINDMYSKDLSQRSKTAKVQYAKRGECIAAYPIFGYIKSPEDRRKLIPDPPAAKCIQMMFDLAVEGTTTVEIARKLNQLGISTPSQRKEELGAKRRSWGRVQRSAPEWTSAKVLTVLREERYTGKLMAIKWSRFELGNPVTRQLPREDWVVVENAFEPIITEEVFQQVQALHPKGGITPCKSPIVLFSWKIHCALCGSGFIRVKGSKAFYRCSRCKNNHHIREDDLIEAVLAGLRQQLSYLALWDQGQEALRYRREQGKERLRFEADRLKKQVDKLKCRKSDAFVSHDSGKLNQLEYERICKECNAEIAALQGQIKELEAQTMIDEPPPPMFESQLRAASSVDKLTREIVEELIEDIKVFPNQRIEIVWKFRDELKMALAELEGKMMRE